MASHHKHHMKMKHHRAGGRIAYTGNGSNVEHEAEEKKHGGAVHHMKMHGHHKGKHRIHKKRGGSVGSDHHPFSSAAGHGMGDHPADHGGRHGHAPHEGFVAAHGKK